MAPYGVNRGRRRYQTGRIFIHDWICIYHIKLRLALSSLFLTVQWHAEKESFLFVSGRSRKHFLPDQLLDTFFKTDAAFRTELQENGICSAADAENK